MERITAERVVSAYKRTGLMPLYGETRKGQKACALSAVCQADLDAVIEHWIELPRLLILDRDYAIGFVDAWDSNTPERYTTDSYKQGLTDGQAAREAVQREVKSE